MNERGTAPASIRRLLNKELCEKLVQSSSLTIGCNVLITDERGYVIASNNKEREGIFHEASMEVIESGQNAYHDSAAAQRLAGTRPGMTIPLFMEDQVIGTIGITGSPQDVSRYAVLLQQMSQIFLSFQSRQQTSAQLDYRKQSLLREIITFDKRIRQPSEVYSIAYEVGVDLNLARAAILFRVGGETLTLDEMEGAKRRVLETLRRYFPDSQDFVCPQSDAEYVVLACLPEGGGEGRVDGLLKVCRTLEEEVFQAGRTVQIGIGSAADSLEGLRQSYEDACFAMRVLQTGIRTENCLACRDLALEWLAASLPEDACAGAERTYAHILQSPKRDEILEIVDLWCRLRFRFTQTAEALHIHKSTLVYRFQRIQEIYGLDLYDFQRVIPLFLLSIRRRLS